PELYNEFLHQPIVDYTTNKFYREREAVLDLLIQGIIKKFNKKQSRREVQILANNSDFKIALRNLYQKGSLCKKKKISSGIKSIRRNKFEKLIRKELGHILN
ncbi:hypothetical protein N9N67_11920, partial [Bacteriovoracaceae bacterium]|nr:hypothetical protein [Bacteriovoracaceae bacterium]